MRPVATMRRVPLTIPAGGQHVQAAAGDFVFVEAASADLELTATGDGGATTIDRALVRAAASYRNPGQRFDTIRVSGTPGATATIWVGEGEANLNILSGNVSVVAGGTYDSSANVTINAATSLDVAADATRKAALLQVPSSAAADLWVRDQSGTSDEGMLLGPAGLAFLGLECSGAFRVHNGSGVNLQLRMAEVKQ
jgi:hypothetical protein